MEIGHYEQDLLVAAPGRRLVSLDPRGRYIKTGKTNKVTGTKPVGCRAGTGFDVGGPLGAGNTKKWEFGRAQQTNWPENLHGIANVGPSGAVNPTPMNGRQTWGHITASVASQL